MKMVMVLFTASLSLAGCQPFSITATNTGCCGQGEASIATDQEMSCHGGGVNIVVNGSNNKAVPFTVRDNTVTPGTP